MRLTDEVRVGMIATLGLLLLAAILIFLRGQSLSQLGTKQEIVFRQVSGLKEGAEVRMAGVVVGNVDDVSLTKDQRARVSMLLQPEVDIPPGSTFTISTQGLLGDPFVRVIVPRTDSPEFREEDLEDVLALAEELRRGDTPLTVHLRRMLSPGTRDLLSQDLTPPERTAALHRQLVRDLNQIIESTALYDEERFQGVPLSSSVRQLIEKNPREDELVRLNRRLLEQAFPRLLKRMPKMAESEKSAGPYKSRDPVTLEELVPQLGDLLVNVQGIVEETGHLLANPALGTSLQETAENLAAITANVNSLISDPRLSRGMLASLENAEEASRQAALTMSEARKHLGSLADSTSQILANVEGITGDTHKQIQALLPKFEEIVTDLGDTVDAVRWLVEDSGVVKEQLPEIVASGRKSVENIEKMTANLEALTGDPAIQGGLKESLASLKDTLDNVKEATASLKDLAADPELHADVRETVSSMRTATAHAASVSQRVDEVLGSTGDSLAKLGRFEWETSLSYRYLPETNRFFGDLNFDIWPSKKNFFRVGIHDFAEHDKLQLQAGSFLSDDTVLRFGLLRAKLGVGLEKRLGPRYSLSADLYDPNDVSLNLWGRYRLDDDWSVMLGMEELGNESLYGMGVQFTP